MGFDAVIQLIALFAAVIFVGIFFVIFKGGVFPKQKPVFENEEEKRQSGERTVKKVLMHDHHP